MARRRIVYGVALLAALAFQIFYDGYLAQFFLVCVIALPLLSLLLSLRGVLGVHLGLSASTPQLIRGDEGQWQVTVNGPSGLPISQVVLTLSFENSFTGWHSRQRLRLSGLSGGAARTFPMAGEHCGLLTCRLVRARALDFLGLFAFPVSVPDPVQALVFPAPAPTEDLPELPRVPVNAQRTGTPSMEDYELREYRPGDPLRTIHWKLSSKHDSLVVREPVKTGLPQVALTFDLFGDEDQLDQVLGRLWSLSLALLDRGIAHTLVWLDQSQQQQEVTVDSRAQLTAAMASLLAQPATELPPLTSPDLSHLSHMPCLHVTTGEEDDP